MDDQGEIYRVRREGRERARSHLTRTRKKNERGSDQDLSGFAFGSFREEKPFKSVASDGAVTPLLPALVTLREVAAHSVRAPVCNLTKVA